MKIAVISDTHMKSISPWFAKVYDKHMADSDVLIHCGDITREPVLNFFLEQNHPQFYAVAGNSDEQAIVDQLPVKLDLDLDGLKVGVAHGWGGYDGLSTRVAEWFGPGYDLICFGHTHVFEWTRYGDARVLCPGALKYSKFGYGNQVTTMAVVDYEPDQELRVEMTQVNTEWWKW